MEVWGVNNAPIYEIGGGSESVGETLYNGINTTEARMSSIFLFLTRKLDVPLVGLCSAERLWVIRSSPLFREFWSTL